MPVYDMDSHLREEYFLDEVYRLADKFAEYTPVRLNAERSVRAKFHHSLHVWPPEVSAHFNHSMVYDPQVNWKDGEVARRQVGGWDMDVRLNDNAREGIDYQMLFPSHLATATYTRGELGAALARAYNSWAKNLVAGKEDRLWPIGILPWGHPEALVDELDHCVNSLGFKAVHLTPYTHDHTLDHPAFEPFFDRAEKLRVPLMLHPASHGELINRYDNFFAMHVLGRPFNCTAGLVALVTGGIFERHPNLKVAFFECSAEWILYWMHRLDDDYERMKGTFTPNITRRPSEYIKKNCYVTCEADEKLLRHTLNEFSEDRVLLASDYPHFDSEYPGTVHHLRERSDITDAQKEKILHQNAREFLGL